MLTKTAQTVFLPGAPAQSYRPYSKTCPPPIPKPSPQAQASRPNGCYATGFFVVAGITGKKYDDIMAILKYSYKATLIRYFNLPGAAGMTLYSVPGYGLVAIQSQIALYQVGAFSYSLNNPPGQLPSPILDSQVVCYT